MRRERKLLYGILVVDANTAEAELSLAFSSFAQAAPDGNQPDVPLVSEG
jgi:hypothetical protein